jgi:hypothetical protein
MKCVRNKFLVKLQMKKRYWMLANVLLNIKHQHGDFKIRNDEVDPRKAMQEPGELNLKHSYFHFISTHPIKNHLLVVRSGSRGVLSG